MQPTVSGDAAFVRAGHRGVSYGRISEDDGIGDVKVTDQLVACRATAESHDIGLVAEHSDNDISALTDHPTLDGSFRPGFRKVVEMVKAGQVDYVVCWQTSRLVRNRGQRAAFIDLCGRMKVKIVTVKGQDFNLASASGRGLAGMLGEFDTMESEIKSERNIEAALRRARGGRPNSKLGYGWTRIGTGRTATFEINEPEAEIVREVIRRIAAGDSIRGIMHDLNERGVPAAERVGWIQSSIRRLALRPSNAGLRIHHPGQKDEQTFPGCWPALVPTEQWERVVARLEDTSRTTYLRKGRVGSRKHMLSFGIGKCGVCGSLLRTANNGGGAGGTCQTYNCMSRRGCVGRNRAKLDALVDLTIGHRLSQPDALAWALPNEDGLRVATEREAELEAELGRATDRWADGRMSAEQYDRFCARLQPRLDEARAERRMRDTAGLDIDTLKEVAGPNAIQNWRALPLARKVALLWGLGIEVFIDPTPRGPKFHPDRVRITGRGVILHPAA